MKLTALLAMLAVPFQAALADSYAYVSVGGEQKISIFRMNEESGMLSHAKDVAVDGAPGSLAVDPQKKFLFAALRSSRQLGSFRIDSRTGDLKLLGGIDVKDSCAYVATDRAGRFLLSAYYGAGRVAVHRIRRDGTLDAAGVALEKTAPKAHAVLTDLTNKYVYVPHTGPNAIFHFRFDARTGKLSPGSPARVNTPEGTEPRHLAFHPNGQYIYFDNERGSSVTAFRLDKSTGAIEPFQTLSTLPDDFDGKNSCADVEMHPTGRFLYSSNRGHDSIACFAVDAKTGRLKSLGQAATEKTPRSFNVDPSGRFLYAAGQGSGKLASYRIDQKTGTLKRFDTFAVGKGPGWVQVVAMPGSASKTNAK